MFTFYKFRIRYTINKPRAKVTSLKLKLII